MSETKEWVGERLNEELAAAHLEGVGAEESVQFERYLNLLVHWNARVNLTAVRDPEQIVVRHFMESIVCARALPAGIKSLLDFGSGAGFPGIPIAICRPEIAVTLAESQNKKAAFLKEAARTLDSGLIVHGARAETLEAVFDCVTMRAVDRMEVAVKVAAGLVGRRGWLVAMTTMRELSAVQAAAGEEFQWNDPIAMPDSEERVVAIGRKSEENA